MIRLFLVDDHAIMRDGLRALLSREADLQIVGEASHGQELLDRLPAAPADVVLLDLNMPVLDGLATTQRLRVEFPEVRVLVLSMLLHERYVGQLFEAGACGYALKNDEISELVLAIQTVAAGRQYLCNELSLRMLDKALLNIDPAAAAKPTRNPYNFSRRETEVLHLLSEGLTTSEIADKLFTSKRTIETHRQNMLEKSQARNAAALIKLAMSQGVLQ
ncbi:response regulator transcription factor [Hymenobacter sp. BT559]|uniref:response regulator transcription factor n=1 Tax=Hymenobacter sp. BT559 TaxID=2795729 RepID=UPI0018EC4D12|nr:response regulator transcription factor [Hymenobacter sp. BT559]MBJ6143444.1 response regulator transcription factor [Hymenobacter sp. BT559]